MGDPKKKLEVQLAMLTRFRPRVIVAIGNSAALGARAKKLAMSVDAEIKKGEVGPIRLVIAGLQSTLPDVEADLAVLDGLADELERFTKDNPEFVQAYDDVKAVSDDISEARRKAASRGVPMKALIHKAEQALAKLADNNTEILNAWSEIDAFVRSSEAKADSDKQRLDEAMTKARIAKLGRNASDLEKAKAAADGGLAGLVGTVFSGELRSRMEAFAKRLARSPHLSKNAELARQKAETQKAVVRIEAKRKANDRLRNEIRALKVEPIDMAKVVRELGDIAANLRPKIEWALGLEPTGMLKTLDALLREAGHALSGKDAIAKLKKAKVL